MKSIYNPGNVDTDQASIRVKLTPKQVEEVSLRLSITAETPDLPDWGWLDGRTLHIIDKPHCRRWAVEDRNSDLLTLLDIAEDNASSWADPQAIGQLVSMRSLVRKAQAAVAGVSR